MFGLSGEVIFSLDLLGHIDQDRAAVLSGQPGDSGDSQDHISWMARSVLLSAEPLGETLNDLEGRSAHSEPSIKEHSNVFMKRYSHLMVISWNKVSQEICR